MVESNQAYLLHGDFCMVFLCLPLNRRCTWCSHEPDNIRGHPPLLPSHLDRPGWSSGEVPRGVHDCVRTPTTGATYHNELLQLIQSFKKKNVVSVAHFPCGGVEGTLALMCPDPLRLMGNSTQTSISSLSLFGWQITLRPDTQGKETKTHSSQFRGLESKYWPHEWYSSIGQQGPGPFGVSVSLHVAQCLFFVQLPWFCLIVMDLVLLLFMVVELKHMLSLSPVMNWQRNVWFELKTTLLEAIQ